MTVKEVNLTELKAKRVVTKLKESYIKQHEEQELRRRKFTAENEARAEHWRMRDHAPWEKEKKPKQIRSTPMQPGLYGVGRRMKFWGQACIIRERVTHKNGETTYTIAFLPKCFTTPWHQWETATALHKHLEPLPRKKGQR